MKDLIKKFGSKDSVPKKKKAPAQQEDEGAAEASNRGKIVAKMESMAALIDVLRASSQNDYSIVAKTLQEELKRGVKKMKGFGSST